MTDMRVCRDFTPALDRRSVYGSSPGADEVLLTESDRHVG
jgi:hypothetical protein